MRFVARIESPPPTQRLMSLSGPRADALSIWQAGVDAVRAERLVGDAIRCSADALTICGQAFPLAKLGRIAVVGAGKAGAGMAAAIHWIRRLRVNVMAQSSAGASAP